MLREKDSIKQIYNQKICKLCKLQDTCNRDVFCVYEKDDKTTMKCSSYQYIKE